MPLDFFLTKIDTFFSILVRMTGLFVVSPVFGRKNLPVYFKISLAFLLSVILFSVYDVSDVSAGDSLLAYFFVVLKEFMIGLISGYITFLIFSTVYLAGQLIDMKIGFSMANVFDPMSNMQISITSNFYFIISILTLLCLNGHHVIIKALFDSFTLVPLGTGVFKSDVLLEDMLRIISNIFVLSFKISAPVIAATIISDIALGIMMRTIPQINIFAVGMPLKVIMGLVVILITITVYKTLVNSLIEGMSTEMFSFFKHIQPEG